MCFDPFDQVAKGLEKPLEIRRAKIRDLSQLVAREEGGHLILINEAASRAQASVGLLYQLVQLADRSCLAAGGPPPVPGEWLQDRTPTILLLLVAAGLTEIATLEDLEKLAASGS